MDQQLQLLVAPEPERSIAFPVVNGKTLRSFEDIYRAIIFGDSRSVHIADTHMQDCMNRAKKEAEDFYDFFEGLKKMWNLDSEDNMGLFQKHHPELFAKMKTMYEVREYFNFEDPREQTLNILRGNWTSQRGIAFIKKYAEARYDRAFSCQSLNYLASLSENFDIHQCTRLLNFTIFKRNFNHVKGWKRLLGVAMTAGDIKKAWAQRDTFNNDNQPDRLTEDEMKSVYAKPGADGILVSKKSPDVDMIEYSDEKGSPYSFYFVSKIKEDYQDSTEEHEVDTESSDEIQEYLESSAEIEEGRDIFEKTDKKNPTAGQKRKVITSAPTSNKKRSTMKMKQERRESSEEFEVESASTRKHERQHSVKKIEAKKSMSSRKRKTRAPAGDAFKKYRPAINFNVERNENSSDSEEEKLYAGHIFQ